MNDMIRAMVTTGVVGVAVVIIYIVESIFLAKIASDNGKHPLLAWIPIVNYFLIRDMAGKKSHWKWLVIFLGLAICGSRGFSWIGTQALIWCSMVWYWSAFSTLVDNRTTLDGKWVVLSIIFIPCKIYAMYKMAE